jgi:predicted nucleic acid-binding protein
VGIVLDSSVVIDLLRGYIADESVLSPAREPVMISAITVHEVLVGLRDGEGELTNAVLESFAVVPLGIAEAGLSARWRRHYKSQGVTLAVTDTVIAATAALRGVPLLTGNVKHFPMPELQVERWPAASAAS